MANLSLPRHRSFGLPRCFSLFLKMIPCLVLYHHCLLEPLPHLYIIHLVSTIPNFDGTLKCKSMWHSSEKLSNKETITVSVTISITSTKLLNKPLYSFQISQEACAVPSIERSLRAVSLHALVPTRSVVLLDLQETSGGCPWHLRALPGKPNGVAMDGHDTQNGCAA